MGIYTGIALTLYIDSGTEHMYLGITIRPQLEKLSQRPQSFRQQEDSRFLHMGLTWNMSQRVGVIILSNVVFLKPSSRPIPGG